jgi:hypothetical protein
MRKFLDLLSTCVDKGTRKEKNKRLFFLSPMVKGGWQVPTALSHTTHTHTHLPSQSTSHSAPSRSLLSHTQAVTLRQTTVTARPHADHTQGIPKSHINHPGDKPGTHLSAQVPPLPSHTVTLRRFKTSITPRSQPAHSPVTHRSDTSHAMPCRSHVACSACK